MRYYKQTENGYITGIGRGLGGEEITESEYHRISDTIWEHPLAEEGYGYRLREDLSWEEYELPVINEDEEEISDKEALDIILGGESV